MLATRTAEPAVLPLTVTRTDRKAGRRSALIHRGADARRGPGRLARRAARASVSTLPNHTVPAALYAPLAARIDRLHGEREVVQAAAVIGREFTLGLLAGVTRLPEQLLLDALARLSEARLICRSSSARPESYAFTHMLIRDVAYGMLLLDRRRQLHQRIAEVLRWPCMEQGAAAPELLAHHYALAGLIEPAVRYWLLAGRRAFRMAAYREADRHLRKGIALLDRIPEGGRRAHFASELKSNLSLAPRCRQRVRARFPISVCSVARRRQPGTASVGRERNIG